MEILKKKFRKFIESSTKLILITFCINKNYVGLLFKWTMSLWVMWKIHLIGSCLTVPVLDFKLKNELFDERTRNLYKDISKQERKQNHIYLSGILRKV